MDIEEALKLADELVFAKTATHLDYLQKAILNAALQSQTYSQVAEQLHTSESHVRNVGSDLWKILSEGLGENSSKTSFRAVLESVRISKNTNNISPNNISFVGDTVTVKEILTVNNLNICPTPERSPTGSSNTQTTSKIDLTGTPTPTKFYNRTQELTTLKQWIIEERTPLITLLGLSGIGKTALTLQLIQQIQNQFDYIIWKSLENPPTLQTLETNIIEFLSHEQQTKLPTLIDYLRTYRCLLIFDDLQNIFTPQQLAGHYQPNYENYGTFIKKIAQTSHNSCLILITWEKPREITLLETENRPIHTLELNGLDNAQEILQEKNLSQPQKYSKLSDLYQGNPLWLNIITATIQELFNSNISEFLSYEDLFLGDIEPLLNQHFQRLTQSEKQLLSWLANQNHPIDISKKPLSLQLTPPEFLKVIQSLNRRCLLQKTTDNHRQQYILPPIIKQYIKNNLPT
ncbi:NB-ARC domain-containing protein [Ancylothrix sp. C2]|uniref:NB-ARC domain-containing protein n=1 Tax=Ancylothrix sp. D3o TaxID=2953691 RepID=UPI0021BA6576|nr:NB-ARC domain-containing protein [Ancylothrix sp. D3o]MCT7948680.1 NB-ARC domain-containing protein [Ancylothrix sp. D3o]